MKVPHEVIAKATRCDREHACVHKGAAFLCRVEEVVGDEVFFIARAPNNTCRYCSSFGEDFVCNCPVRAEAHRRGLG